MDEEERSKKTDREDSSGSDTYPCLEQQFFTRIAKSIKRGVVRGVSKLVLP